MDVSGLAVSEVLAQRKRLPRVHFAHTAGTHNDRGCSFVSPLIEVRHVGFSSERG